MAEVLAVYKYASPARTLVAVLNGYGLNSQYRYEAATNGHAVCLLDDSQLAEAQAITRRFSDNPNSSEFTRYAWESGSAVPMAHQWSLTGMVSTLAAVPVVSLILLLCIALYIAVYGLGLVTAYEVLFFQPFAFMQESLQWWRLVSPAFIHFSVEHLIFNLIWWGWLGSQVEKKNSSLWLIVLMLLLASISNVAQFLVGGWQFGGMSGVVYGLTGYVWWMQWLAPERGLTIPKALVGFSLIWMMLGFADVLWINMANTAHLVGLIAGCCLAVGHARLTPVSRH